MLAGKPALPSGIHGNAQGIPQPTPQEIQAQGGSITYP
jgi:hypothetical protein